jgi:hypothetical protein
MITARNARRLSRKIGASPSRCPPLQGFTAKRSAALCDWYLGVLQRCGAAPHHRAVAVAHEAGHAVVALTLGGRPGPISVHEERAGVWGGYTTHNWPPEVRTRLVHPLEHPLEAMHGIVNKIAGYEGEEAASLAHPASSPDEIYPLVELCSGIAHHLKLDADRLMARIMGEAADRIAVNRKLFDAISHELDENGSITAGQVDELVSEHGLVRVPLRAAWKAVRQ